MKKYRTVFNHISRRGEIYFRIEVDDGNGFKRLGECIFSGSDAKIVVEQIIKNEREWVCVPVLVKETRLGA